MSAARWEVIPNPVKSPLPLGRRLVTSRLCVSRAFRNSLATGLNETVARAFRVLRCNPRGRFFVGEPVAMHRPAKVPFDGMGFPLILADGLRAPPHSVHTPGI